MHQAFDAMTQCADYSLVYLNPRIRKYRLIESYKGSLDLTFIKQNYERIAMFNIDQSPILARKAG
jgi:hypothetical protein